MLENRKANARNFTVAQESKWLAALLPEMNSSE